MDVMPMTCPPILTLILGPLRFSPRLWDICGTLGCCCCWSVVDEDGCWWWWWWWWCLSCLLWQKEIVGWLQKNKQNQSCLRLWADVCSDSLQSATFYFLLLKDCKNKIKIQLLRVKVIFFTYMNEAGTACRSLWTCTLTFCLPFLENSNESLLPLGDKMPCKK